MPAEQVRATPLWTGAYRLAMETWRELSAPGHVTGTDPHAVLMP